MEVSRRNSSALEVLKSNEGFAITLFLSLLPVILAAGFAFLFSSYLAKNWMQSLHICRTELLRSQAETAKELQTLLNLNHTVLALRRALLVAEAKLAAALASYNPVMASEATAEIVKIKSQQKSVDQIQRSLIYGANFRMSSGISRVIFKLQTQNGENLSRASSFFRFKIDSIHSTPHALAVQADIPDIAPIYELKPRFEKEQALSVFWNSTFQTDFSRGLRWIKNHHIKKDYCSVSLQRRRTGFETVLNEDRSLSRP